MSGETWQVARVLLRTWVREPGEVPRRPWLTMIMGLPGGFVLGSELATDKPTPEDLGAVLAQTRARPQVGPPRWPAPIVCPESDLAADLASRLAARWIVGELGETPELREVVTSLEENLQGKRLLLGLLETPGVTPVQVGRLFAAAFYYCAAPWRVLSDAHPIAVRVPAENPTARYVVMLGNGGLEFGLAVCRSSEHLAATYTGVPLGALVRTFEQGRIT